MYEQSDLALIGSRIKAVRTGKGMSQADLAVKASVSLPLISNIERGKTRMQLETFVKVSKGKGVSALVYQSAYFRINKRLQSKLCLLPGTGS